MDVYWIPFIPTYSFSFGIEVEKYNWAVNFDCVKNTAHTYTDLVSVGNILVTSVIYTIS